jgi:hypothetical protein
MSPLASVIAAKRKTTGGTSRIDNAVCWYRFDDITSTAGGNGVSAESILRNSFTMTPYGVRVNQVTYRGGPALDVYSDTPPPTNPIVHFNGISIPTPTTRKYLGFNPNWGDSGGGASRVVLVLPWVNSVKFRVYVKTAPAPTGTYVDFFTGSGDFTNNGFQGIYQNKPSGVFSLLGWTGASENNVWYRIESYFAINSANCFHKVYDTSENLVHTVTYTSSGSVPLTWLYAFNSYYNAGSWPNRLGISDLVAIANPANTDPIGPQR